MDPSAMLAELARVPPHTAGRPTSRSDGLPRMPAVFLRGRTTP